MQNYSKSQQIGKNSPKRSIIIIYNAISNTDSMKPAMIAINF
jgi:hypothetical protein